MARSCTRKRRLASSKMSFRTRSTYSGANAGIAEKYFTPLRSGARSVVGQGAPRHARHAPGDEGRGDQPDGKQHVLRGRPRRPAPSGHGRDVADDVPVIHVEERARQHARRGQHHVAPADARQPEQVVQDGERHQRREPQQEHDPGALRGHGAVDGGRTADGGGPTTPPTAARGTATRGTPARTRPPRRRRPRARRPEPEERARGERQQRAGHEQRHGQA